MSVLREGELEFTFGAAWEAEAFDRKGIPVPKGVHPVDFIVERQDEIVLLEVKDPSASGATGENRQGFVKKMKTKELTHQDLVPKARTTYNFLHLMARDTKPMRYVVVIGTERLPIEPPLLMNLADRLKARIRKEADEAWKREYMFSCIVVATRDIGKALPDCSIRRLPSH